MSKFSEESFDSVEEMEKWIEIEREIDKEASRFNEECGEVVSYNRGFCDLPNFGDWRDKRYGLSVWSGKVRKRDGYKCRRKGCGSKENLHAHHIFNQADNPDLRYEIWNGITLCQTCHITFHKIYGKVENNEEQIKEFISNGGESYGD